MLDIKQWGNKRGCPGAGEPPLFSEILPNSRFRNNMYILTESQWCTLNKIIFLPPVKYLLLRI